MTLVCFEHCIVPCIDNDRTRWHVAHGWIWNIVERKSRRKIGVFYASLLCGDGACLHFEVIDNIKIPFPVTLSAMRRGLAIASAHRTLILATVYADYYPLLRICKKLGFIVLEHGEFEREGKTVLTLKYLRT